jgi:hypothetical protein
MKRLQIMLDEDLDAALDRQSVAEGVSKAAIVRRLLRAAFPTATPLAADPLARMIGVDDFEPAAVDDVVYR